MPPQKIYQDLVNSSTGGPRHCVTTPRNQTQVRNFRKEEIRDLRISHDSFFNTYRLCFQLYMNNRKGEKEEFIRHFSIHPTILVHLIPQSLLDSLELVLKISLDTVVLHYDTVFNIGDYYLSTLMFRHSLFKHNPVVPLAFFIHSRRFAESHHNFIKAIRQALPVLATKKVFVVTDQEFDFSDVLPISYHLFCWNHLEQDLLHYLKNTANCNSQQISYYANAFKEMMLEESQVEFDRLVAKYFDCDSFVDNEKVCQYFQNRLLPTFTTHSAIWHLKEVGISNPENGITNNAAESFNAVLHHLKEWKDVPLDVICVSLFHLSMFYYREIERGFHQCGPWQVKPEYVFQQRDPTLLPNLPKALSPKEIVQRARGELLSSSETENQGSCSLATNSKPCHSMSQLGLAREAVDNKWVSLPEKGCWIVKGSDGSTPNVVTLHPKETCSCAATKSCYHIMACKLMLGQNAADIEDSTKPNASLLHRTNRRKNKERPAGRKQPRRNDFDNHKKLGGIYMPKILLG